jgi:hypothetical protein
MLESTGKTYLDEIRRQSTGGKVTVYRHREWILAALREGNQKRQIYDLLVDKEGLTISYQQFAKLTAKLMAEAGVNPAPAPSQPRPKPGRVEPAVAPSRRFQHNPIPDEDELF